MLNTWRLLVTFFFAFSLKLWLKNEHQGCRPFIKFFKALISTDPAKQTQVQGATTQWGGGACRNVYTWTLSRVWTFGVSRCEKVSYILVWIISVTLYCTQYCVQFHTLVWLQCICSGVSFSWSHFHLSFMVPICLIFKFSEETCCNVYISLVILHDGFAKGDCIPEGILF